MNKYWVTFSMRQLLCQSTILDEAMRAGIIIVADQHFVYSFIFNIMQVFIHCSITSSALSNILK